MSQRLAMIMALVLTLVLGTGVYAARGRVIGTEATQSNSEVTVVATEEVVPTEPVNQKNPAAVVVTEDPADGLDESISDSRSDDSAERDDESGEDDEDHDEDESDDHDDRDSEHEEDDDD